MIKKFEKVWKKVMKENDTNIMELTDKRIAEKYGVEVLLSDEYIKWRSVMTLLMAFTNYS